MDSSGVIQQCVIFESETKPVGVKDLKKVEIREGMRTTGIGPNDDVKDENETQENPQDSGIEPNEINESKQYSQLPPVPSFANRPSTEHNMGSFDSAI